MAVLTQSALRSALGTAAMRSPDTGEKTLLNDEAMPPDGKPLIIGYWFGGARWQAHARHGDLRKVGERVLSFAWP